LKILPKRVRKVEIDCITIGCHHDNGAQQANVIVNDNIWVSIVADYAVYVALIYNDKQIDITSQELQDFQVMVQIAHCHRYSRDKSPGNTGVT
jgi:hypothetical protein